ncbi:hypothetical protein RHS01_09768 [Rhizoctonia solani]|uniref:Uncharacterized protein n=1 Tax=Rhizoctonia solani TaxID=456999 RepID=A0A8H7M0L1_9AGAM|nr:hypothetical protein RHS01_09768 [Rhizoctonia solani]
MSVSVHPHRTQHPVPLISPDRKLKNSTHLLVSPPLYLTTDHCPDVVRTNLPPTRKQFNQHPDLPPELHYPLFGSSAVNLSIANHRLPIVLFPNLPPPVRQSAISGPSLSATWKVWPCNWESPITPS